MINSTGTNRIVIDALDSIGNPSYFETIINAALSEKNLTQRIKLGQKIPKIAFLRPSNILLINLKCIPFTSKLI